MNISKVAGEESSFLHIVVFKALPYLGTALLGAGIKSLIDEHEITGETGTFLYFVRAVGIVLASVVLALIVFTALLKVYIAELKKSHAYKVSIHQDLAGFKRKTAYDYCAAVAHQAKESITIIGPHFPLSFDTSPTHDEYLREGLDKALERAGAQSRGNFRYRRIVQLDESQLDKIDSDGGIEEAVIGNRALAKHLKESISRNLTSRSIDVKVYGRVYIPSFPSVMIVDQRYVFFSLPTERWAKSNDSTSETFGRKSVDYDLVLTIEDVTGEIPSAFLQVATQFEIESREIKHIKFPDSGEAVENSAQL